MRCTFNTQRKAIDESPTIYFFVNFPELRHQKKEGKTKNDNTTNNFPPDSYEPGLTLILM